MKSIFAVAAKTLGDWQKEGLSKADIERLLAQSDAESQNIATVLSGNFWLARDSLHIRYNEIFYTRPPIAQLANDYELPTEDARGVSLAEEKALAEKQMRRGALKLIAHVMKGAKTSDEFPFRSTKQKLEKLYTLCIPKNKLEWDMSLKADPGKPGSIAWEREGFTREFANPKDATEVMDVFNTILFSAYGSGHNPQIIAGDNNPRKVIAAEGVTAESLLNILRVEESWRHRKEAARRFARG